MGRGKSKRSRPGGNGGSSPQKQAAPEVAASGEDKTPAQSRLLLAQAAAIRQARQAQMFASAVAVMMRDPRTRDLRVKDLEMLLVPAIAARQCIIAQSPVRKEGPVVPVGVLLWARVSDAVDKRLANGLAAPSGLRPEEWQSGQNHWIVLLAGEAKMLPGFLKQVLERDMKGQTVKMRAVAKDGTREVKVFGGEG